MSATHKTLQLTDAKRILEAAHKRADEIKQPMCIAVVCSGGHLLAFERMENAWRGSVDIAINKAWTSRAFDIATSDLAKFAQPGKDFYGIDATNHGRVIIFAGGIPILQDGVVVGAIGASGGSGEQDESVGKAGAEAF